MNNSKSSTSEYSILLLSIFNQTIPFPPQEWTPTPTPTRKHKHVQWSSISSPSTQRSITSAALTSFHTNQSQHGTNTLVRIDLQHTHATNRYTSTSITRLPDLASQTPALVNATVPGGEHTLPHLLSALHSLPNPPSSPPTTPKSEAGSESQNLTYLIDLSHLDTDPGTGTCLPTPLDLIDQHTLTTQPYGHIVVVSNSTTCVAGNLMIALMLAFTLARETVSIVVKEGERKQGQEAVEVWEGFGVPLGWEVVDERARMSKAEDEGVARCHVRSTTVEPVPVYWCRLRRVER